MDDMPATNADTTHPSISDQIMKDKNCTFEFCEVSVEEVKVFLMSINNDKPPGSDNLDGKLLRIMADYFHSYLPHLQFKPTRERVPSGLEGSLGIIKPPLLTQIADQSACYQPLVNFWGCFFLPDTCCFTVNKSTEQNFSMLIVKDTQQAQHLHK